MLHGQETRWAYSTAPEPTLKKKQKLNCNRLVLKLRKKNCHNCTSQMPKTTPAKTSIEENKIFS